VSPCTRLNRIRRFWSFEKRAAILWCSMQFWSTPYLSFFFFQNLAGQTATLTFFVFWPFFGQFHHKAAHRRRTTNILLRNVGLLWLLLPCWTQNIFEKSKIRKIFLDFFGFFFDNKLQILKIFFKFYFMHRAIWALYRSLHLYETVFR